MGLGLGLVYTMANGKCASVQVRKCASVQVCKCASVRSCAPVCARVRPCAPVCVCEVAPTTPTHPRTHAPTRPRAHAPTRPRAHPPTRPDTRRPWAPESEVFVKRVFLFKAPNIDIRGQDIAKVSGWVVGSYVRVLF